MQRGRPARGEQHFHRRNVQRAGQRRPVSDRSVTAAIIVFRAIKTAGRRETCPHVRHHRGRGRAAFEREQISKRLQGRPGRALGPCTVHLSGSGFEIIFGTDERDHVTGRVVDHHRGGVANILLAQLGEPIAHDFFHLFVQTEVERGSQFGGGRLRQLPQDHFHEMRRAKPALRRANCERLGHRGIVSRQIELMIGAHPFEDSELTAARGLGREVRVQFAGIFRQSGQKSPFGIAQIGDRFAEVIIGGSREPDIEVTEIEAIEVSGENLVFRPGLFEAKRGDALD